MVLLDPTGFPGRAFKARRFVAKYTNPGRLIAGKICEAIIRPGTYPSAVNSLLAKWFSRKSRLDYVIYYDSKLCTFACPGIRRLNQAS